MSYRSLIIDKLIEKFTALGFKTKDPGGAVTNTELLAWLEEVDFRRKRKPKQAAPDEEKIVVIPEMVRDRKKGGR